MKKGYWILIIFGIWCVISAIWYMFSVKGLSTEPSRFSPQPTTMGIIEILIMILVAFILGFGVAWLNRSSALEVVTEEVRNTRYQITTIEQEIVTHRDSASELQRQLQQHESVVASLTAARDTSNKQLEELIAQQEVLQKKNKELEAKVTQLDADATSARFRVRLLEGELSEKDLSLKKMSADLEEARNNQAHRDWSDHPFVRPVPAADENSPDDLTKIKGIGPAFQRKLYSLDIRTFRQISELDGEGVERLAEVIEVFPDRIHRDNWIGQATRLYLQKIGKEA